MAHVGELEVMFPIKSSFSALYVRIYTRLLNVELYLTSNIRNLNGVLYGFSDNNIIQLSHALFYLLILNIRMAIYFLLSVLPATFIPHIRDLD